ncbi:MAG: hypothetical protein IMZ65_03455, partial [Planctomycetes bacterium]|nr:hypothetical protein [Planctomycetota bacterium]
MSVRACLSVVVRVRHSNPTRTAHPRVAAAPNVNVEGFVEHDTDAINGGTSTSAAHDARTVSSFPKTMRNTRLTWTINSKTLMRGHYGRLHGTPSSVLYQNFDFS